VAAEPLTVAYLASKTVTVAIRRDADGCYFDFNDSTFKASGWTTRLGSTTPDTTEASLYRRTVDPATWTAGVYQVLAFDSASSGRAIAFRQFDVVAGTLIVPDAVVLYPVASDGDTITLVQGDDYNNADGRALSWTDAASAWPAIAGAEVKLSLGSALTITGTVVSATEVRFALTAAQTGALKVGRYEYDVQAKLATTNRIATLVRGTAIVVADVTP